MNMKDKKQVDLLNGPMLGKIITFALPLALSSILQQLFNSADMAVVGRFASANAMAAVGSNSSVIALIVCLFTGLSVGANVVIGTLIGQNKKEKINESVHTIMTVALICGVVLIGIGIAVSKPLLTLMGAPEEVFALAVRYLRIYFCAMPGIMVYNFGSAILRSKGDSKHPMYMLIVSGAVNLLLNLLFVIAFHMDVVGVGLATVISNFLAAGVILWILMHEEEDYRLSFRKLTVKKDCVINMVRIGLPAGLQGVIFAISNVVIQSAVNSLGAMVVAGATAGANFESMCYLVLNAFVQTAITFTAQNFGAGKADRCKKVFRITLSLAMISVMAFSAIFWFGRGFFLGFFTTDTDVAAYAEKRMMFNTVLYFIAATYEISGGCLRGMGRSTLPTILSIIGTCAFRVVYVQTVFRANPMMETLFAVYPLSWIVSGTMVMTAYLIVRRKLFKGMKEMR
ncbi:MAG: MATE family efflux transporter [Clostridia bacterium]|nr:MATE family efflux transporter [Clostridia bacterium]